MPLCQGAGRPPAVNTRSAQRRWALFDIVNGWGAFCRLFFLFLNLYNSVTTNSVKNLGQSDKCHKFHKDTVQQLTRGIPVCWGKLRIWSKAEASWRDSALTAVLLQDKLCKKETKGKEYWRNNHWKNESISRLFVTPSVDKFMSSACMSSQAQLTHIYTTDLLCPLWWNKRDGRRAKSKFSCQLHQSGGESCLWITFTHRRAVQYYAATLQ